MRAPLNSLLLIILVFFVESAHAQSAQAAIRAFIRLDARLEVGISYRDYVTELGELNFELKSFADSKDAARYPEIYTALYFALRYHLRAQEWWEGTFRSSGIKTVPPGSDLGKLVLADYPDAALSVEDGGATIGGEIDVMKLLPFMWRQASRKIAEARKILRSME